MQYNAISLLRKSVRGDMVPSKTNHGIGCQAVRSNVRSSSMDCGRSQLWPSIEGYPTRLGGAERFVRCQSISQSASTRN